jgi:tRNA(fMet)-specific endonuclease VapC
VAVLDTNVLIDLGDPRRAGHAAAATLVRNVIRRGDPVCTTRINIAELRVGIERATDRAREEQRFERATSSLFVLELDEAAAEHFGRTKAYLFGLGRPVGDMDALIAAICLTHNQRLITRNGKHFADVPGLVVEGY